jgi:hypothetical protein
MRTRHRATLAALILTMFLGQGCLLLPEIQKRVVELAVGGSTTQEFVASGELNIHDKRDTVDVRTSIDLPALLDDAGIDLADVEDIKFAGVAYRVTQQDPAANRAIQNGTVTIQRGLLGTERPLVDNFNVLVNDPASASFQTATLNTAGVALINQLLTDILTELKGGPVATNTLVITHVNGTSTPGAVPTDFKYELRLDVSILGTVHVDVPN